MNIHYKKKQWNGTLCLFLLLRFSELLRTEQYLEDTTCEIVRFCSFLLVYVQYVLYLELYDKKEGVCVCVSEDLNVNQ